MAQFKLASQILGDGGNVRRKKWPAGNYCFLEAKPTKLYLMMHYVSGDAASHQLYWDDIKAKDWEIVA